MHGRVCIEGCAPTARAVTTVELAAGATLAVGAAAAALAAAASTATTALAAALATATAAASTATAITPGEVAFGHGMVAIAVEAATTATATAAALATPAPGAVTTAATPTSGLGACIGTRRSAFDLLMLPGAASAPAGSSTATHRPRCKGSAPSSKRETRSPNPIARTHGAGVLTVSHVVPMEARHRQ
jgi:hypothetical protein